ncbi:UDP-N-acetylglucosamine 2-epimerase (non-hydrolyzing) [candidate division KSB1 bacterium]|nr:UDP-N-acetylglucosamine 2-epimerase (non-hydrolyzing) [candidate division KSB1 bacterium]
MRVVTIVGARPQFIKAAPVSTALRQQHDEFLVHTGQHYDDDMSRIFFDELHIPRPDINLNVGSGTHAAQTAQILQGIEQVLVDNHPDAVILYGDTNSTLAGAMTASKLNVPIVHVEAGLRSFNRMMPEEINRILTDRVSTICACPTQHAIKLLASEGITEGVHFTGDVMFDAVLKFRQIAVQTSTIGQRVSLDDEYCLLTLHRAENTDSCDRLTAIVTALIASKVRIIFPVHPRTRNRLMQFGLWDRLKCSNFIHLIEPVGYLDMQTLTQHAHKVLTDSGGLQKEAYFLHVPCITLRDETEWVETVDDGWNCLAGAQHDLIVQQMRNFQPDHAQQQHYGDGHASEKIVEVMERYFG